MNDRKRAIADRYVVGDLPELVAGKGCVIVDLFKLVQQLYHRECSTSFSFLSPLCAHILTRHLGPHHSSPDSEYRCWSIHLLRCLLSSSIHLHLLLRP